MTLISTVVVNWVKVADHVGHRWARDGGGVYCTCAKGQRIRLYANGACWNSPKRQALVAKALDTLRDVLVDQRWVE